MPAELLEDTLVDDLEATSLPEEEAAPDDAGETEVEQEPENPYEGKTREEIDALIEKAAQAAEAKARQSEKDKADAAARAAADALAREQFQRDQVAAQNLVNGTARTELLGAFDTIKRMTERAIQEGNDAPEIDQQWMDRWLANVRNGLRAADVSEWVKSANDYFAENTPDGWTPPQEHVVAAAQAQQVYGKQGWLRAALAIAESRGIAKGRAEGREQAVKDEEVKTLESKNGRQPGPTGSSAPNPPVRDALAIVGGHITSEEADRKAWAEAYPGVDYPIKR